MPLTVMEAYYSKIRNEARKINPHERIVVVVVVRLN